jgi:hypothetical protein
MPLSSDIFLETTKITPFVAVSHALLAYPGPFYTPGQIDRHFDAVHWNVDSQNLTTRGRFLEHARGYRGADYTSEAAEKPRVYA